MKIVQEVVHKDEWEEFLLAAHVETTPFFQSWYWADVQKKIGHPIYRLGLYDDGSLIGIALLVEVKARRGHYLHVRHGPILKNIDDFLFFFGEIKLLAKQQKCDFIRTSPLFPEDDAVKAMFKKNGFRNAPIHNMDAENAWILPLDVSEEELLKGMRKTTRYLVRKSQTLSIEVQVNATQENFEDFLKLYKQTSKRHGFVPHRGLREEFEEFKKEELILLLVARYEKKVIAGAMIVLYGNQAVYHHGATSDDYKEIPAAYLLQWEAIKHAKKKGKKVYNFWGVVPENKPNHPWRGLSLFKMGFGGRRINFIHAQDYPLSLKYWKTFAIETITKKRKGY